MQYQQVNLARMSIPRKRHWFRRLLEDQLLYEIIIGIAAFVVAIWESAASTTKDPFEKRVISICAIVILAVTILKYVVAWRKSSEKESPHELAGCLHTLHAIMLGTETAVLRITIHVPVQGDQEIEQVMDYVGEFPERKTAGQRFPSQSGIAGASLRLKQALSGERGNDGLDSFIKELVRDWHYTEVDAKRCNLSARSWLAIPLLNDEKAVEGVIFFDCDQKQFFSKERQDTALRAAAGIARFIKKRY